VRVANLRVGETTLDVEIVRALGSIDVRVAPHGPPVDLEIALPVPLGARSVFAGVGGTTPDGASLADDAQAPDVVWGPHDGTLTHVLTGVSEGGTYTVSAFWQGGLSVAAAVRRLVPGQKSTGVRVVDFTGEPGGGEGWLLELEGQAGHGYDVRLHGGTPRVARSDGAEVTLVVGEGGPTHPHFLRVRFPEGEGRTLATIHLEPAESAR
jgi:hypothetical protein